MAYQDSQGVISIGKSESCQPQPYILREDEKIPLFLIKLWNIVEDPGYYDVIRWDESGYSFHIMDPYSFCRNVLPQFFKHNNLNSLIRQLNMYGFRKMTPIERTSLARAESDQDHLEFSHPYFVREHPELLVNIKRKVPNSRQPGNSVVHSCDEKNAPSTVNVPTKDLNSVLEELRQMRERQKHMEQRINEVVKENEMVWQEMGHLRSAHVKQQQIVNKLVQFLVSLVQPNKQQRLGKRHLLAIDEFQAKRSRDTDCGNKGSCSTTRLFKNLAMGTDIENFGDNLTKNQLNANEVLDSLISEMSSGGVINLPSTLMPCSSFSPGNSGPIIAEVTDELDQLNSTSMATTELADNSNQSYSHQGPKFGQLRVRRRKTPEEVRNVSIQPQQLSQSGVQLQQQQFFGQPAIGRQSFVKQKNNMDPNTANSSTNTQRSAAYAPNVRYDGNGVVYAEQEQSSDAVTSQEIVQQPRFAKQQMPAAPIMHMTTGQQMVNAGDKPSLQLSYIAGQADSQAVLMQNLTPVQPQQQQQCSTTVAVPIRQRSFSHSSCAARSPIVESPASQNDVYASNVGTVVVASPIMSVGDLNTARVNISDSQTAAQIDEAPQTVSAQADPRITFNDSPSDFNEYLNSMNHSINQCRDNIANHWELNNLIDEIDPNEWLDLLLDDEGMRMAESDIQPQPFSAMNSQIGAATPVNQLINVPMDTPIKKNEKK